MNIEVTHGLDDVQPGPHPPLGIVLMRLRVTEINQNAVAHVFRDKPVEAPDDTADGAVIGGEDVAIICPG